jgi:hypothetical protein
MNQFRFASLLLVSLGWSSVAWAGERYLTNDQYSGSGQVNASVTFGSYEGAGVLLSDDPANYPLEIIAVDVLAPPAPGQSSEQDAFLIDIWGEFPDGGGVSPPETNTGSLYTDSIGIQGSNTQFTRITLSFPVIVSSGQFFIGLREQNDPFDTGIPNYVTVATDTSTTVPNGNWLFRQGVLEWESFDDPNANLGIPGNWILRAVINVPGGPDAGPPPPPDAGPTPDAGPSGGITLTSITPDHGDNSVATQVVLLGSNFAAGVQVLVGPDLLASLTVASAAVIQGSVPAGISPGTYDVTAINADGTQAVLHSAFTVTAGGTSTTTSSTTGTTGTSTSTSTSTSSTSTSSTSTSSTSTSSTSTGTTGPTTSSSTGSTTSTTASTTTASTSTSATSSTGTNGTTGSPTHGSSTGATTGATGATGSTGTNSGSTKSGGCNCSQSGSLEWFGMFFAVATLFRKRRHIQG